MTIANLKNKGAGVYFALGFLLFYGVIFYPAVSFPYAAHAEFRLWSYDPRENILGYPELYQLAVIGRVLAGYFSAFQAYFIRNVADVGYLRCVYVAVLIFSATVLAMALQKRKVEPLLAFLFSAGIFLAPGLRGLVNWGWSTPAPIAACLSMLAGMILPSVGAGALAASMALLLAAMFFYPPSAMLFLLFPLAGCLFSQPVPEKWREMWRPAAIDLGVFMTVCGVYFGLNRWIIVPAFANRPEAVEFLRNHPYYQFRLLSFQRVSEKAGLFKKLTVQALDFFQYDFVFHSGVSRMVFAVIAAGFCLFFLRNLKKNADGETPSCYIGSILGLALALSLLINAPILLSTSNLIPPRTHSAYSGFFFLLFSWAVFVIAGWFGRARQVMITRVVLGAVVVALGYGTAHNGLRFAYLASSELKYMEAEIAPHIGEDTRIHVIRPRWSAPNDLYYPNSYQHFFIPLMIRSIYVKLGKAALFHPENITCGNPLDPLEKTPGPAEHQIAASKNYKDCNHWVDPSLKPLVVDMNPFVETFLRPSPGSPPPAILLKKNYLGFDIIRIDTTLTPYVVNPVFAVTAGEYDLEKKSCPLGGCAQVFGGPTLESVIEWIDRTGWQAGVNATVEASSNLSQALGATNLLVANDSPPWHSQKPAKFPEWVRIAYSEPAVMSRLLIQSQPPDNTGNPQLGRAPSDFIVQGSHDGQQWTDLYKVLGAKFTSGWEWKEWQFDNKTAYTDYRLYITATNGDPTLVSMNRLRFERAR